jgi:hypothetical protein
LVQIQQRLKLRSKPLAYRLYGFYSSHAAAFPYNVATLRELSGSEIKELYKFRQALRRALETIQELGVISAWEIDPVNDLVTVTRNPSSVQLEHLRGGRPTD